MNGTFKSALCGVSPGETNPSAKGLAASWFCPLAAKTTGASRKQKKGVWRRNANAHLLLADSQEFPADQAPPRGETGREKKTPKKTRAKSSLKGSPVRKRKIVIYFATV